MAIKTWLTREQFEFITRAVYDTFNRIPTGDGVPKLPDGMWALGALKGFKDTGKDGTDIECNYIICRLTRWYRTPEEYIEQFAQYHEDGQDLELNQTTIEEYVRVMMDKNNFFRSSWFMTPEPEDAEAEESKIKFTQTTQPAPQEPSSSSENSSSSEPSSKADLSKGTELLSKPQEGQKEPDGTDSTEGSNPSPPSAQSTRETGKEQSIPEVPTQQTDHPYSAPASHRPSQITRQAKEETEKPEKAFSHHRVKSKVPSQPKPYVSHPKPENHKKQDSEEPVYHTLRDSIDDLLDESTKSQED